MEGTEATLMARVKALDPARNAPLAEPEQTDQTLRWVLAQPRDMSGSSASRSRLLRPVAALTTAVAVGLVAVVVALWPSSGESAYASWVPIPTELDEEAVAASADQCGRQVTLATTRGHGQPAFEVEPVLAEERGELAFILLEGEHTYMECVVVGGTEGDDWDAVVSVVHGGVGDGSPDEIPAPYEGDTDITVLSTGSEPWAGHADEGDITSAYGLAGPDVESIEVMTSDGARAQATVDNGWWAVWFPGDSPIDKRVTVTTTDGYAYTANLWALYDYTQ